MTTPTIITRWQNAAPYLLGLLRIAAAIMFILSGTMKIFAFPAGMPPDNATAEPFSQIWIGGMLEVFGGALLLVGLYTRPIAFLLSGMMAVAYFQFHAPGGVWPIMNGGVAAALYCFVWLYFSAAGAGALSIDAARARGRRSVAAPAWDPATTT